MKVTNRTKHELVAFGWHTKAGVGEDVRIPAGTSAEVNGPDREMEVGALLITLPGKVVCHEVPDNESGFQVLPGKLLVLENGDLGLAVGHPADLAKARAAIQSEGLSCGG
jgi:hypothetical protein